MKTLNELHQWMEDNEYFELANQLALIRYKASMWDKYNNESRIPPDVYEWVLDTKPGQLAAESGGGPFDSMKNPHLHEGYKDAK